MSVKISDMSGFSETNLKTMRLWYRFYAEVVNGQQVVDELQPIGIARYELSNALSKEYQRSLPTIEVLESEVAKMMNTK